MKNKILAVGLVLALFFTVGWTYRNKDNHQVNQYTLTYEILAVGLARVSIPVECEKIIIKTATGNAGNVHIGGVNVISTDLGFELDSSEQVTIDSYTAANSIWVIATQASQSIHYICFN